MTVVVVVGGRKTDMQGGGEGGGEMRVYLGPRSGRLAATAEGRDGAMEERSDVKSRSATPGRSGRTSGASICGRAPMAGT
jgi:hypothetical protein